MRSNNVIAKGKYRYPQKAGLVTVNNYIIVKENGKKYLLLRFFNERNEVIDRLAIKLVQYDSAGKVISSAHKTIDDIGGVGGSQFVPECKIELEDDCADFRANIISAEYGRYSYSPVNSGLRVDYVNEEEVQPFDAAAVQKKMGGKNFCLSKRNFRFSLIICLLAVVLAACLFVFVFLHLNNFKNTSNTFSVDDLEYTFLNGREEGAEVSVSGYHGLAGDIVIPDTIAGYKVVEISSYAFANNKNLHSVDIESSVTVGANAFAECSNLQTFDFGGVNSIGDYAFYRCTSLATFATSSVELVGAEAFSGCTSLEEVNIGGSPGRSVYINEGAFKDCNSLYRVTIDKFTYYPDNVDIFSGCYSLTTLLLNNIPSYDYLWRFADMINSYEPMYDGLSPAVQTLDLGYAESVSEYFFQDLGELRYLNIDTLYEPSLPDYTFAGCHQLESASFGTPITYVGNNTFADTAIKSFNSSALTYLGVSAFSNCAELEEVVIDGADLLYNIPNSAFYGCTSLESVTLPEGLNWIEMNAFYGCSSLEEIVLPQTVVTIDQSAFEGCRSLKSAELPASLSQLGDYAFRNCNSLTDITVPSSISRIGLGAFEDCTNLASITLPFIGDSANGGNGYLSHIFGAYDSWSSASYVPSSLKTVTVTSLFDLPSYAFAYCDGIDTVILPDVLVTIGDYAFFNCASLTSVTIPDGVQSIGQNAFQSCTSLSSVAMSEGVQTIGQYAFADCTALTSFTVPDSVQSIGYNSFGGCSALEELTLPFVGETESSNTFFSYLFGGSQQSSGYVPESLKTVTVTKDTTLSEYAFYRLNLQTVNLPEGLTGIGSNCFYGCNELEEIQLPESVQSIGDSAFQDCDSLKSITIPEGCASIGLYAFESCNNLGSVTLPSTLTSIGYYAFGNCYRLYKVFNNSSFNLTPGGYDDSGSNVAQYALAVYEGGAQPEAEVQTAEGCSFLRVGGVWYLTSYPFGEEEVVLPSSFTYGGTSVSNYAVPHYLFYQNYEITSLTVPAAVTSVGEYAFYDSDVEEVTFAQNGSLTRIENSAFGNCNNIKTLDLPSSLEYIGGWAFSSCTELASVTVREGLTMIYYDAFNGCRKLREVYNYSSLDIRRGSIDYGCIAQYAMAVYTADDTEFIQHVTIGGVNYAIYGGKWYITGIDGDAFEGNELNVQPLEYEGQTVTEFTVISYAFIDVYNIEYVTFGAVTLTIEDYAFYNTSNLRKVTFDGTSVESVGNYAFADSYSLEEVILPEGLTSIGEYAFNSCQSLHTVWLPSTLNSIGTSAFYGCNNLFEVYNLSSLRLTAGNSNHGYVAYNAVIIHASADEESIVVVSEEDFVFVKDGDKWVLKSTNYYVSSYGNPVRLPESFMYGEEEITSYEVGDMALDRIYSDSLLVPLSVTALGDYIFGDNYTVYMVYYGGTAAQWLRLVNGVSGYESATVYYYADCVHEDGLWTYDDYGNIISYTNLYWNVVTSATCTEDGLEQYVCGHCGEVLDERVIPATGHNPDENGYCIYCGQYVGTANYSASRRKYSFEA